MTVATVEVNGSRLAYERAGEQTGLPVVLVHAGVCDQRMWDDQFEVFSRRHDTIRYDARGFGRSDSPAGEYNVGADLAGFLRALGLHRAAVVGVSRGSMTAVDFALQFPDMVGVLVLAGGGVGGGNATPEFEAKMAEVELAQQRGDLELANELELRVWVDGWEQAPDRVAPEVRARVAVMNRSILEREPQNAAKYHRDLEPAAISRLSEAAAPTLVLIGDRDLPFLRRRAERMEREIPGARLVVMRDAAHLPNLEHPEEFNRLVLDFLAEVVAAEPIRSVGSTLPGPDTSS